MKMGGRIAGTRTIPDLISQNKEPYYNALEAADESVANGQALDLGELEGILENLLADQLISALEEASGHPIVKQ
jgi:hypothetical protein